MIVIKIDPAKIKDVIGPGGKVINKIIADTGVEKIDIEDDGSVFITSLDGASGDKARADRRKSHQRGRSSARPIAAPSRASSTSARSSQILPGKEGLVHISQLAPTRVEKVEDVVKLGDEVMVKVMEIDGQGRINLSRKALLGGGVSGNGDYGRGPRAPREPRDSAPPATRLRATRLRAPRDPAPRVASGPGAPPTRRRRRPQGRRDEE